MKIKLQNWDGATVMQTIEIEEELRNKDDIFKGSKISLKSVDLPSFSNLFYGELFLPGLEKNVDKIVTTTIEPEAYNNILETFKEYGIHKAQQMIQEPTELDVYKWFAEISMCKGNVCRNCCLYDTPMSCHIKRTFEELKEIYKKHKQPTTTFKWIDEALGIFEV
jgi:hypothetical protein